MNWKAVAGIARKDILYILRDPMTLFWIVIFPAMLVLLSAYIWVQEPQVPTYTTGIYVADQGNISKYIIDALNETEISGKKIFQIVLYNSNESLIEDIREGKVSVGIVFPEKFSENITKGFQSEISVYIYVKHPILVETTKQFISGYFSYISREMGYRKVEYVMKFFEKSGNIEKYIPSNVTSQFPGNFTELMRAWMLGLVEPLKVKVEEVKPETLMTKSTILGWIVVAVVGVSALFSGLITGTTAIVEEKDYGTLHRILASPITGWELLLGKTLGVLFSVAISGVVAALVGAYVGAKVSFSFLELEDWIALVMLALATLFFVGLGLILSIVVKTAKAASGLAMAIAFPMMFTSGIWWPPKEMLPEPLKTLANYNPATLAIDSARAVLVFNEGLSVVIKSLPIIAVGTLLIYAVGALVYRVVLKKYALM